MTNKELMEDGWTFLMNIMPSSIVFSENYALVQGAAVTGFKILDSLDFLHRYSFDSLEFLEMYF